MSKNMSIDNETIIREMEELVAEMDEPSISDELAKKEAWDEMPPEFHDLIEGFDERLQYRAEVFASYVAIVEVFEQKHEHELSEEGAEFLSMLINVGDLAVDGLSE